MDDVLARLLADAGVAPSIDLALFDAGAAAHQGLLVSLWLAPATAAILAVPGGEAVDELHLTLCYCGDVSAIGDVAIAEAITAVAAIAEATAPLRGATSFLDRFAPTVHSDGKVPIILRVTIPGLIPFRTAVADALTAAGVPPRANFEYQPHITLAYIQAGTRGPAGPARPVPLVFEGVTISVGDQRTTIAFGAEARPVRPSIDLDFTEGDHPRDARGQFATAVGSAMDALAAAHPQVAENYTRSTYTERGSIGAHTREVGDRWATQITPAELAGISDRWGSDVDRLMAHAIALHDIGKADAVESKGSQHAYTVPILQDVLAKEGFRPRDVKLATALVGHDLVGKVARGLGGTPQGVAKAIATKAHAVGMATADFATLQLALFHADAGAYPYIRQRYMTEDATGKLAMTGPRGTPLRPLVALAEGRPYRTKLAAILDGTIDLDFDEAQHPRDDHGRFGAGIATDVGITSVRPGGGKERILTKRMNRFEHDLKDVAGVRNVSVARGTGAWQGGGEPTWIVHYEGNGEANKLLAATGKRYDQDAVLVTRGEGGAGPAAPVTEWTFADRLTEAHRAEVDATLAAAKLSGWTWFQKDGHPALRAVYVPQWADRSEAAHTAALRDVSAALDRKGLRATEASHTVHVDVMTRTGAHSYDQVLGAAA